MLKVAMVKATKKVIILSMVGQFGFITDNRCLQTAKGCLLIGIAMQKFLYICGTVEKKSFINSNTKLENA